MLCRHQLAFSAETGKLIEVRVSSGRADARTWGVPVEEIQRGIKFGVRKVNIDTDSRMAMKGQIRKVLAEQRSEFDPRKYLKPAMDAMAKLCKQRFEEFGTAGKASGITPLPLAAMAKRYAAGELAPVSM